MNTSTDSIESRLAFTLGDRLAKALAVANISNNEMAAALGVSRNTIGNYINGHSAPKRLYLKEWALSTGVPLAWLETGQFPHTNTKKAPTPKSESLLQEPPVGLEPTTCALQGGTSAPVIDIFTRKAAA